MTPKGRRISLLIPLLLAALAAAWWIKTYSDERFCWIVFGPKGDTRLLLRVAHDEFFLDRNGDGRFDGPGESLGGERAPLAVTISNLGGGVTCTLTSLQLLHEEDLGERCLINADVHGPTSFSQLADTGLSRWRRFAPVTHFNGPLTVQVQSLRWELPPGLALRRGQRPTDLRVYIGTLDRATECWSVVRVQGTNSQCLFPTDVHPMVSAEFPARTPDAPPLRERYELKEFC